MISAQSDIDYGHLAAVRQRRLQEVAWLELTEGDRSCRAYRCAGCCASVSGHARRQVDGYDG